MSTNIHLYKQTSGLESVFSRTKKSYYRQFSTNIKKRIMKLIPVYYLNLQPFDVNKIGLNLVIFHFNIPNYRQS